MKAKQFLTLALGIGMMAGFSTAIHPAWSEEQPASNSNVLGSIQYFEVRSFEEQNFSSKREPVLPEIVEYARTAIQNDERLRYQSPGEGVLQFRCENRRCGKIRAEVTQGNDGPVIWSTVKSFRPLLVFSEPSSRRFAKSLIEQLAQDYQKAIQAVPVKIQIEE